MGGFYLPSPGDVHVNTPLTNLSVMYLQDAMEFAAVRTFPVVPVDKRSDVYYKYSKADFFRDQMQERAPGAEAAMAGYRLDNTATYRARVYALNKPIADQTRANADAVLNMDQDATYFLTQQALIRRENVFAAAAFTTGIWGTDMTGRSSGSGGSDATHVLLWDDPTSTPIEDIRKGKVTIKQNTGQNANIITISEAVWQKLVDHPDIVDRVKYGQTAPGPAIITKQAVAQVLELEEVIVMGSVSNTAAENQTASLAFIGGKSALLSHRTPRPGLQTASAGYTFAWTGLFGAGAEGNRIKRYRWEKNAADFVEAEIAFDMNVVATDLGYFFSNVIA